VKIDEGQQKIKIKIKNKNRPQSNLLGGAPADQFSLMIPRDLLESKLELDIKGVDQLDCFGFFCSLFPVCF